MLLLLFGRRVVSSYLTQLGIDAFAALPVVLK